MVLHTLIINLFKYIALLVGVAVVVRTRVPTSWLKSLIAAILAILVIHLYAVSRLELFGLDFQFFWKAGCDVWGGVDPYSPSRFTKFRRKAPGFSHGDIRRPIAGLPA